VVAVELNGARRTIDWSEPWFDTVGAFGQEVAAASNVRTALDAIATRRGVSNARGVPIRFGAADAAGDAAYEEHIARTGEVPTRDNMHDLFNALVWLRYPRTKARLNMLQAHAIAEHGIGQRRGARRDAATLVDENAVFLITRREDIIEALQRHEWHRMFIAHRERWGEEIRAVVFGHALLEKLTAPYKGITAHALAVRLDARVPLVEVDAAVAAGLDAGLTPRRLLPLPVLGIPGWANNDDPAFYNDGAVFRPARTALAAGAPSSGG